MTLMAGLSIRLLGPPAIIRDDDVVRQPRGRKAWGLLAYLSVETTGITRQRLASMLFPDAEDPLGALRWNLSQIRTSLGEEVALTGDPLRLVLSSNCLCDVRTVTGLQGPPELDPQQLQGEFLEGLSFTDCPVFDAWLEVTRHRIANCVQTLLYERALASLASGASGVATAFASLAVDRDPFNADCQAVLVKSLVSSGDHRRAREQVARCGELFHRELGVGVPDEVRRAIFDSNPSAATDLPATEATIRSCLDAASSSLSSGAVDRALDQLRLATALAGDTADGALQAEALVALAGALIHQAGGRGTEVADLLHRAIAAGAPASATRTTAAAYRELGFLSVQRGAPDSAAHWLEEAMKAAEGVPEEEAKILGVRGMMDSDTAHYERSLVNLADSEALAAAIGSQRQQAFSLAMIGRVHLLRGDLHRATVSLNRSLNIATSEHWTAFRPFVEGLLGETHLAGKRMGEAGFLIEHAWVLAQQAGDHCFTVMGASNQARLSMARGDPDGADRWIQRGLEIKPWYFWYRARLLDTAADIAIATGSPRADEYSARLKRLAGRSGLRELIVRAQSHRAVLGDASAAAALPWLAKDIDNPALDAYLAGRNQL